MTRRRLFPLVALVALLAMVTPAAHGSPAASAGQLTTLSTTDRLADRREVAAGTRAYSIGFEDGRFYANGWHITGEMGGVWAPPLKLVDGVWFGLDDQWVGPATRFSSGWGFTRFDLPDTAGLKLDSGTIGDQFWGPQPGHRCTGTEPGAPADPKPSQCDDGPFGRGTGGEL